MNINFQTSRERTSKFLVRKNGWKPCLCVCVRACGCLDAHVKIQIIIEYRMIFCGILHLLSLSRIKIILNFKASMLSFNMDVCWLCVSLKLAFGVLYDIWLNSKILRLESLHTYIHPSPHIHTKYMPPPNINWSFHQEQVC